MTTDRPNPLADFWDGTFPIGPPEDTPEDTPEPATDALTPLGPSGLHAAGRDLAALLAPVYAHLTGRDD